MSPSASPSHGDASGRTPTTASWFRVYWLTSQARYVRVSLPRRAMHASCESPWHLSAKHHVLGACFSLMAPFRTRFSRYKMAYSANVQRLIGCLYILWYCYIPPCRCTAQCDLRAGPGSISIGMNGSSGSIIPTHLRGIWSGKEANHLPDLLPPTPFVTMFIGFMTAR